MSFRRGEHAWLARCSFQRPDRNMSTDLLFEASGAISPEGKHVPTNSRIDTEARTSACLFSDHSADQDLLECFN